MAALIVLVLQALAGAALVYSQLSLVGRLVHASLVALYVVVLSYLALHLLPRPINYRTKIVPRVSAKPARPANPSPAAPSAVSTVEPG
jgi:hypothetical protein